METADIAAETPGSTTATQDLAEHAIERAVNDQVRSQGLARAVEWHNGIRSDVSFESSHQQVRAGLERMYASPAAAAGAETALVRYAEERGIAAALDRFMRKPHRFGQLRAEKPRDRAREKDAARAAARELAPRVSAFLIERETRSARLAPAGEERAELTPAQVRREREDRVLRAAALDRLRAAGARRWGFNDRDEYTNFLPFGRNVLERNPNGTVREYLAEPRAPVHTIHPYSDVATRTTYVADRSGVPVLVPAQEAQTAAQLRPVEIPLDRRFALPFQSHAARLPGESPRGLRGRAIPYPLRPSGRPQAHRFHTCVACSYGKHSAHARNYDLCKDCHRIIGSIPTDLFRDMVHEMKNRGLVERRAESFGHTRSFAEVAKALAARWRAENLEFGTIAGERYVIYPHSEIATRLTLAADADGRPLAELPERLDTIENPARPFYVPAATAFDRELYPVTGAFPHTRRSLDLAGEIGKGLALTEDELMISGDRGARTDQSPFEIQPDLLDEGRLAAAARLSDFTEQRPIEVNKGSGLSKEQIFALSDAAGGETATSQRRPEPYPPLAQVPHSFWTPEEREGARRAVERHNRGHADPLFFSGPPRDDLTTHALAGALTPERREEARRRAYERDRAEAVHEDAAWDRRRERLRIRDDWREHNDWSGPLRDVTPPTFNKEYAGSTGVDESLDKSGTNDFLSKHRTQVDAWLAKQHDARVKSWLARRGISEPSTANRVAQALRDGKEAKVVEWLEGRGVPRDAYDRDRAWLEEVNPAVFHRSYPVNPPSHDIGDLTPEAPINVRLDAQDASRAAEVRNWSRHGGALSRTEARAALREYRDATAVVQDPLPPPTPGAVATERGAAEGPLDAANARARLEAAAVQFRKSVKRVFANPKAFLKLFNTVTPQQRTQILAAMEAAPGSLEATFGPATRLRVRALQGKVRQADVGSSEYGQIVRRAYVPGKPITRAAEAALDGRDWLDARRAFRRAVETVAASAGLAEAVQERRIEFRAATLGLFQDPTAFHRAFDAAGFPEKRVILSIMAEHPEQLESRIGAAGRLATGPGNFDPRWTPLVDGLRVEALETGKTASARGRAYLSTLTRHAGRVRSSLRGGRIQARTAVLEGLARHFPEAHTIDAHARLSAAIGGLSTDIDRESGIIARVERTFDGLVATANEFREQLKVVVTDADGFVEKLKHLSAAEKHRVFDMMLARPGDLSQPGHFGAAARLTEQAPRFMALVVAHGRHYVERSIHFRDLLQESGQPLGLKPGASKSEVCTALRKKVEHLRTRIGELATERAALRNADPALAEQHHKRVKEWLAGKGVSDPGVAEQLAQTLREGKEEKFVEQLREHGISRESYQRDRAWIEDVAPDLGKAAAQWRSLADAERVQVAGAYPHLARAMARVETARHAGASGIGRQKRTTALKEHSGQHRARNKPVAGLEL